MEYRKVLIDRLKEYCELLGLTQSQIAKECGVEQKTVSNWFNGKSVPNNQAIIEKIEKIIEFEP